MGRLNNKNIFIGLLATLFMMNIAVAEIVVKPTEITKIYDGDSFKAVFEVWPNVMVKSSIRILYLDTPELRGKCEAEKKLAIEARKFTEEELRGDVRVTVVKNGKFGGRVLAHVTTNGEDLATKLIEAGLGRHYDGGKRNGWC